MAVKNLAAKIAVGVLFAGLLAAVIAVSVLLAQANFEIQELKDAADNHTEQAHGTTPAPPATTLDPAPGTTPAPIPVAKYRLPKGIKPTRYDLFLHIHLPYDAEEEKTMADKFTTKGSNVAITLQATEAGLSTITLHARTDRDSPAQSGHIKRFAKEAVTLTVQDGGAAGPTVTEVIFDVADLLVVKLDSTLEVNKNYVLKIAFDGVIANDNQGLYRSSFTEGGATRYLATSQFQPFKARRAFPSFDEPGFRSVFSTTLKYGERFTRTRTNGEAQTPTTPPVDKWITTSYLPTPEMSVYLNAFLVSDFELESTLTEELTKTYMVNVIGNPVLMGRGEGVFAGQQGSAMMKELFITYNQPYPLTKLDMAGVPDFNAGAMENWGLVLYRESSLMYRPKVSTADNKRAVAAIIGHELAHMIFGNLVTCDWWSDTWLNEGFARFMQYELMTKTKPKWNIPELFAYWVIREALQPDSYETSHALFDNNVNTLPQIETMFDTITYAKGGSILQMIKGVMGETNFYSALKKYVSAYQYKNVVHENLLDLLEAEMPGSSLKLHLTEWITQSGYPLLKLTRGPDSATAISYTQERFLLPVGTTPPVTATRKWHIPLTLTDGATKIENLPIHRGCWLKEATGPLLTECPSDPMTGTLTYPTLPVNNESELNYIIANVQQKGFYRVNYDRMNWERIIAALEVAGTSDSHDVLKKDGITRGQLVDDAFNLARASKLDSATDVMYDIPFKLVNGYMTKWETKYGPLASAMDSIRYIEQMLRGTPEYATFAAYMKQFAGDLYNQLSPTDDPVLWRTAWKDSVSNEDIENEAPYDSLLFNNLVIETACYYGVEKCLKHARDQFSKWTALALDPPGFGPDESDGNTVQSRSLVLCYGVRGGSFDNWKHLKDLYVLPTTTTSNKLTLLRALACTEHESLLQQVLSMTTDGSVRSQDVASVFSYLARYPEGATLAWDFLRFEWSNPSLSRKSNMISDVAGLFKDEYRLKQLRELHESAKATGGSNLAEGPTFVRIIARVEANILWFHTHAKGLATTVKGLTRPPV